MQKPVQYSPHAMQQGPPPPYPPGSVFLASQSPQSGFVYPNAQFDRNQSDEHESGYSGYGFTNASVRRGFIRKVFSILTMQLFFTIGIVAAFIYIEPVKTFVRRNNWMYMTALIAFFITYFSLICFESCRRKTPRNYACLFILTLAMAFMTATLSCTFDTQVILLAFAYTAVVTLSLTIFAMQTKIDFTLCAGFLCAASILVMAIGMGITLSFFVFGHIKILHIVYAGICTLLFSLYIVYDTQLIMGGRHIELSPEEYIMGTIQLYLDIIMLFTYIMQIIGFSKD